MQILDIVIYSHDGRRRELSLKAGQVNIITGSSKSGKSALIEIVNYCFGSGQCWVPEGPIRRAVSWFGVRLQLSNGQAFVARRCPSPSALSSEDCFVSVASEVALPDYDELQQNTNTKGLISLLNQWSGVHENLHEPPAGQTRAPLSANVRHALLLCFQPQDEIIRRQQLFHGSDDRYIADALRDTLPYFLGAVDDDYVSKKAELRRLREQLRSVERQLTELRSLRGDGLSKAATLLAQAREVGLSEAVVTTWEETVEQLQQVARQPLSSLNTTEADSKSGMEIARLSQVRRSLLGQQQVIQDEISAARAIERDERGYSVEATEQRARLVSIGIFEGGDTGVACPVCSQTLPDNGVLPHVEQLRHDFVEVSNQLESVTRVAPQMVQAVAELETQLQSIRGGLSKNRAETEAVRATNESLQQANDESTKRAHILGRVALYVESLPELPDGKELEARASQLRVQAEALEEILSDERIQDKLNSICALIGSRMTDWANRLQLEHSGALLRLDVKKLTIIADTEDGPVPMARMGSGANWVGYHLISHLALHEWFVKRGRPVPRFLFLDQPSQVYFPAETNSEGKLTGGKEEDRDAVMRMFQLVFDVVGALTPGLQVVITEHADISEDWYQSAIVERWRGGLKLVPDDWPKA